MTSPPPTPPASGRGVRSALSAATARFAFSATPRLDAELLLAHALGIERNRLLLTMDDQIVPPTFADLIDRRANHEPVAYITGTRAFWTIDLRVAPGVLIPRADSETLIEAAVAHFAGSAGPKRVLDLGTGSGALLLAALDQWPDATGVGIDASDTALSIARGNAERIAPGRATIAHGGWAGTGERFELILCNPPYVSSDAALSDEVVRYEPASALFAGKDGLADYRAIALLLSAQLTAGGAACVEIGFDQGETAAELFKEQSLNVDLRRDLAGRDRCLVVTP